jgi:Mg2+ and Co2+ transporter CorA
MAKILPVGWELPELLRARVGARIGRQRAMFHEGHLLLLLHALPRAADRDRRGVVLWRDPNGNWSSSASISLRNHVETYANRIEALDRDTLAAKTARQRYDVLRELRPVARASRNLLVTLEDARKMVSADRELLAARDVAYDLEREASALAEEASAAMQLGLAEDAEAQTRAADRIAIESHRLNLLAAICLPVTALASILGMNVETGLEHGHGPVPFVIVLASGAALGVALYAWVRRDTTRA